MNTLQKDSAPPERRTQQRIDVQIPIDVMIAGLDGPVTVLNQDISWGGAMFILDDPLLKDRDSIQLSLPWMNSERIVADAQVVRAKQLEDGRYLVAVRFFSLSPLNHTRLEKLLKLLRPDKSDTDTKLSNLVRELEINAHDVDEFRRMLGQLATGHLVVTVFDSYAVDQSIRLRIAGPDHASTLRLRARIEEVRKLSNSLYSWVALYTLMLRLEHPRESITVLTEFLLSRLPKPPNRRCVMKDCHNCVCPPFVAHVSQEGEARVVFDQGQQSVLEHDFPEVLPHLIVSWGDPDMFDPVFQNLILGDGSQASIWPPDAWQELIFLQDVHDLAYGLSSNRRSRLKVGRAR